MFTWSMFWLGLFIEGIIDSIHCPKWLMWISTYQPKTDAGREWLETARNLCAGFR